MRAILSRSLIALLICAIPVASAAGPLSREHVPAPLEPWIDWVLHDDETRACPFLYNNFSTRRCAWPSELKLDVAKFRGSFSVDWQVYADSWVELPGNKQHWPRAVRVNGEIHTVVGRNGKPALRLGLGRFTITGEFAWTRLPEALTIPADTGMVALSVDNEAIRFPSISRGGEIWLGGSDNERAAGTKIRNSQSLTVVRKIVDEIPLQVHTRIELNVTGEPRELVLGRPLFDGFVPISIDSPLPARLEPDRRLRVQLRAGRHVITINAHHPSSLDELVLFAQDDPWPREEVWAFEAHNELRLVELQGLEAIDPSQTRVPEAWTQLPVYSVSAGDILTFVLIRRGDPDPVPNKLSLSRQIWLDFDGKAYTTQDRIAGTITRDWRLESRPELQLGQVVVDGSPRFITRMEADGDDGVELRRREMSLVADARLARSGRLISATGWQQDFESAKTTLNLPPGWDVFAIEGVDNVPRTWIARWTLLDLFLVLVIAAAAMRLWGVSVGGVGLLMLVLVWHAPNAPRYIWLSLFVTIALLRVLPTGRVRALVGGARNLTVLTLVVICIPFAVHECRLALYPQLELPYQQMTPASPNDVAASTIEVAAQDSANMVTSEMMEADESFAEQMVGSKIAGSLRKRMPQSAPMPSARARKESRFELDPSAVIQTGPGVPQWQWNSLQLAWNGPVDAEQKIGIIYIPPSASIVLHLLRVALIGVLLWLIIVRERRRLGARATPRAMTAMVLVTMIIIGWSNEIAAAEFPDPNLLETLRQRLSAPPDCLSQCADLTRMQLDIDARELRLRLELHAIVASAVPLPGNAEQWLPSEILLDGASADALSRDAAGTLWLNLPAGVHQVYLSGTLPSRRHVQVALPLRPHAVTANTEGWTMRGVRDDGQVEAQLQFSHIGDEKDAGSSAGFETSRLPSFVRVERSLRLGLDWSMTTRIIRLATGTTAAVLEVPVLEGESVITPGVEVVAGKVRVALAAQARSFQWQSVLAKSDTLELTAPDTTAWHEMWRVQPGPMWHLGFEGIAPVQHQASETQWQWRPWPNETLTLSITKPQGVPGQALTIDSSELRFEPGKRATDAQLNLNLRSSKGGQYTLRLPPGVDLQEVRIDGSLTPLRAAERDLTVPLKPGAQALRIDWRKPVGVKSRYRSDPIDLGIDSTNHHVEVSLGDDRWTLWAFGPVMGPAVRFWSLLAILILVAIGLARIPYTPLSTAQWLLLAIGLSQIPVPMAALVVLWLLALGARQRHGGAVRTFRFNLMQIGLVILSIAALLALVEAIRHGLLGHPDMHVGGNGSNAHRLRWYADRIMGISPTATVLSVPILVYRLLMLAWALWLAIAIINWLRWGWACFASNGLWRPWRKPKADAPAT